MVLAVGLAVAGRAGPARAACGVLPGDAGEIGAWLVAGPLAVAQTRPPRPVLDQLAVSAGVADPGAVRPQYGTPLRPGSTTSWRVVASGDARLDVDTVVHGRGARTVFLGAELAAARSTDCSLFLGSDDGLAVYLDGHEVYRRGAVRGARDDDDVVPFALPAGAHQLVLKLYVNAGAMRLYARLVGPALGPTGEVQVSLPGVDDATCDALAATALRVEPRLDVVPGGTRLRVTARYPAGTAVRSGETTREVRVTAPGAAPVVATLSLAGPGATSASVALTVPLGGTGPARIERGAPGGPGTLVRDVPLAMPAAARAALTRAAELLPTLSEDAPPAWLPRESLTSVRYVAERLAGLLGAFDGDTAHLAAEGAHLNALLDAVAAERDPYAGRHGALRRGYRTDIDGTLQGYSIYVPPGYTGDRPYPLVVALHGLGGTTHRMLPVLFGIYDEHDSRSHADRYLPALPDARAIIVAPYGFGDAGYRALGERDVVRVVEEVRRAYQIDPDRTYMTGLSMGGIGAASLPLRYPDVFAAAAPLCGYHSYFVRADTRGVRRPWETFLMEARSNASWAENGLHLPLYVVHGTLDRPVDNSRVLVDRYTALGYSVQAEWPELGHNVWSTTYEGGRIVPYFLRSHRDPRPRRVRFRTAGMRWRQSYWVEVDALEQHGAWGDVDAAVDGALVRVTTRGVTALTLAPPAGLFPPGTAQAEFRLDSDVVTAPVGPALSLRRAPGGHWAAAPRVVAPVLGPIRDVFDRPVAVVYGTHDPNERAMDARVAAAWAAMRSGVHAHIPVLADDDVTDALARTHALVLVGTPRGNGYLARIQARLPIRIEGDAVVAGAQRYAGAEVGTTFVAPNPEAPEQVVLVVTAPTPLGVWRSRFLPDLLPDFVVYNADVAPARGRIVLGPYASVLAAGFFRADGAVPADVRDPAASVAGAPGAVPSPVPEATAASSDDGDDQR